MNFITRKEKITKRGLILENLQEQTQRGTTTAKAGEEKIIPLKQEKKK